MGGELLLRPGQSVVTEANAVIHVNFLKTELRQICVYLYVNMNAGGLNCYQGAVERQHPVGW